MKRFLFPGVIVLVVAVLVSLFVLGNHTSKSNGLAGLIKSPTPWVANNDPTELRSRLETIGLDALSSEGTVMHIHQHIDIYVNGAQVEVPAEIGIPGDESFISIVHTHDSSGIIHVESPVKKDFTLGQFFDIWGLRFNNQCLGSYCQTTDHKLKVYVNGEAVGDPRGLVLAPHQEIAVVYGTDQDQPKSVPDHYDFAAGL